MNIRKTLFIVGIIALVLGVALGCASAPREVTPIGTATGTATGTAPGYGGPIEVTVTMEDGFITDVVIRGDHETPAFAQPIFMRAPGMIRSENSAQIDGFAGATITLMGVIEATQQAIDQIVAAQYQ